MTQNASERVGAVCLKYRQKGVSMKDVHYRAATDLGIIHINSIVIGVTRQLLAGKGIMDPTLEAFGSSFEAKLYEMAGLPIDVHQQRGWAAQQKNRVKQSIYRRSEAYKRKRAQQRAALTQRRKGAQKDSQPGYTYKEPDKEKQPKEKGAAGACKCGPNAQCATKACPCVAAGLTCTPACHGSRPALKCKRQPVPMKTAPEVEPVPQDSTGDGCDMCGDAGEDSDPESEVLSDLSCVEPTCN